MLAAYHQVGTYLRVTGCEVVRPLRPVVRQSAEGLSARSTAWTSCSVLSRRPVVSVVTPFLNAERFMQDAIESVFAQTYRDWELLLVDDGSRDGSTAIAHGCAERHPERVRYIEHTGHVNRGMSASRNVGVSHARGKYVAFLDADDVWLPHKLEEQVRILHAQPEAAMVYGLSEFWYSWAGDQPVARDFVHKLGVPSNTLIQPPALLTRFFLAQDAAIPGPTDVLVRRDAIHDVGGFEEIFRGAYEDQAFYAKICLNFPVIAVPTRWDRYRQHPDSSFSIMNKEQQEYAERLFFLNWLAGYLADQRLTDIEILRGLRMEMWRYRHPKLFHLWRVTQRFAVRVARRALPFPVRGWLRAKATGADYCPPVGRVRLGSLRRLTPFSSVFGFDRGLPLDRYYIEQFLARHAADIRGHVLEIEDDTYTRRFGGARVTQSDVLHVRRGEPKATIVADLTRAENIPCETFDCIVLTQTLQFICDVRAAIATVYRILRPGGVVLATVPGISHIIRYDMDQWGQYWSFTTLSMRRLFEDVFPPASVSVDAYGNVLTAASFLYGMASQELRQDELSHRDPDYEVTITIRAVKPTGHHDQCGTGGFASS
jgi:glycosyltransferase involved in cell wall biosynthesis